MDSILASNPAAPGSIPGDPEFFSEKFFWEKEIVDVAKVNRQQCCSGQQRLNYVDRTHLVLASGKLVLQKIKQAS